jgi:hypothetical protein
MRILILVGADAKDEFRSIAPLEHQLQLHVYKNSIPPPSIDEGEGIAIYDCGQEPNYDWADYKYKVGTCETGRHEFGLTIARSANAMQKIIDTAMALDASSAVED